MIHHCTLFVLKADSFNKLYGVLTRFVCVQICEVYGEGLVVCEGDCSRQFHLECLGLTSLPEGRFTCLECRNGEWIRIQLLYHICRVWLFTITDCPSLFFSGNHPCFSCKTAGREVTRCSVSGCGCYYHEDCVRKLPGTASCPGGGFSCPQHSCSTCCLERDLQRASKGKTVSVCFSALLISCLSLQWKLWTNELLQHQQNVKEMYVKWNFHVPLHFLTDVVKQ